MPYGTESFTDRYGDYKQPTIVDVDKIASTNSFVTNSIINKEEDLEKHKQDIESVLKEVLSINAYFAGDRYIDFTLSNSGKLEWNIKKINELKEDSDWLFTLRKYLNKAKKEFYLKNKS